MPFIDCHEKIPAFQITKRLGLPNMFGWIMFGWSQFGDDNEFSGVYQQRRHRSYDTINNKWTFGRRENFFQKPAWPVQPASAARDAQQAKFKTALAMWQALTKEEKKVYNRIASHRSKRGYDYFMHKTLVSI